MFPEDLFRALAEGDLGWLLGWPPSLRRWRDVPWDDPGLLLHFARYAARMAHLLGAAGPGSSQAKA